MVCDNLKSIEGKTPFGNCYTLIAHGRFKLLRRGATEWSSDYLTQNKLLIEVAEIKSGCCVAFFKSSVDSDLFLILPIEVLRRKQCVNRWLVGFAESRARPRVGNLPYYIAVDVKTECNSTVAVRVVTPMGSCVSARLGTILFSWVLFSGKIESTPTSGCVATMVRLRDRLRRCLDWPCRRAGSEFIRDLNNDPSLRKRPVDSEIRCR